MRDTIFIIDQLDEERRKVAGVLASAVADIRAFASAEDFLRDVDADAAGCIVAPCDLGGMGLQALIEAICARRQTLPVVVMGRDDDVAKAVKLVRAGAAEFLEPPISDRRLRAAVDRTIHPHRQR